MFPSASSAQHDCTATVVDSPHGDVLLTAAHCVAGSGAGMVFAPGFHDGISPEGRWTVTAAHLAPGWLKSQDPHDDFAFLTVAPQTINGQPTEIEQVTGALFLIYWLGRLACRVRGAVAVAPDDGYRHRLRRRSGRGLPTPFGQASLAPGSGAVTATAPSGPGDVRAALTQYAAGTAGPTDASGAPATPSATTLPGVPAPTTTGTLPTAAAPAPPAAPVPSARPRSAAAAARRPRRSGDCCHPVGPATTSPSSPAQTATAAHRAGRRRPGGRRQPCASTPAAPVTGVAAPPPPVPARAPVVTPGQPRTAPTATRRRAPVCPRPPRPPRRLSRLRRRRRSQPAVRSGVRPSPPRPL